MDDDAPIVVSAGEYTEFKDTVYFQLIEDLIRSREITDEEANQIKNKMKKMHDQYVLAKHTDATFAKRSKVIANDMLDEQIAIEKIRIEESDELTRLQKQAEVRNQLTKELELVEQKDTMTKVELYDVKRLHEELSSSLAAMKQQNSQLVNPVLERLSKEIGELNEQFAVNDEAYNKELSQLQLLKDSVSELESEKIKKEELLEQKVTALHSQQEEPHRLGRQVTSFEGALDEMEKELQKIQRKIKHLDEQAEEQAKRRAAVKHYQTQVLEKLELNRQTLEERQIDVNAVLSRLEIAKAQGHDITTRKVEMNLKKREADDNVHHVNDQLNNSKKDYESLKRTLKKNRTQCDSSKALLPGLEEILREQQMFLGALQNEQKTKRKQLDDLKDEVDLHVAKLLQQEGVESEKKQALVESIEQVDKLEAEVVACLAEGKRQGKLLSVLSAQRDIKGRDYSRIEKSLQEARNHVKIQEMSISDLTKRCNEISNRLKEFSALFEVVKNERNKYVNLIQNSAQALAEMREKIRILQNEIKILDNELSSKEMALQKENTAHQQAINQRDALRQDMNRLLSEYRSKQNIVEQQIQEVDKLNVVIQNLEKEMILLKQKYEKSVAERNANGVCLIDKNDELCILFERSNQQQEVLKRGEIELINKEESLRHLRLQSQDIKRQYVTAKQRLPELDATIKKIHSLEQSLADARRITYDLTDKMQNPGNLDRWRKLGGEDPDEEQLDAKLQVLEAALDKKRETALEKELVLEEITTLTEKLRHQALTKRDTAKDLAEQLNEQHGRIREVTKKQLACVSELSMYQATALRLQQEKLTREKALEEAKWRFDHGEAPSQESVKELQRTERKRLMMMDMALKREEEMQLITPANMLKTSAEPRPTAYIPDELGIPRPYGNLAPFKPTELGSTMKQHIRNPVAKPIEI